MNRGRPRLCSTKDLKFQNEYTLALNGDLSAFAFCEIRAPLQKGFWREKVFCSAPDSFVDLEIGTGNGTYFAHRSQQEPLRNLVGVEVKYKPLIQTIRRALRNNSSNARVCRFDAFLLSQVFEKAEVDDVFIHFPDPWVSPRKPRNRVFQAKNLDWLNEIQRPQGKIYFKTDSEEYFDWALEEVKNSPYQISFLTRDLHQSERAANNFVTQFENIFLKKGQPIFAMELIKCRS